MSATPVPKALPPLKPGMGRISAPDAVKRATQMLDRVPSVCQEIEERIASHAGPKRMVTVRAFLSLGIALGMRGEDILLTEMAGLARELGPGQRGDLGLRSLKSSYPSYRQLEYVSTLIAKAYDADVDHSHLVFDSDAGCVVHPSTGEIVVEAEFVDSETVKSLCACPLDCPVRLSIEKLTVRVLSAIGPAFGVPVATELAIDSYVVDSYYRPRAFGGIADTDPKYVSESDPKNRKIAEESATQASGNIDDDPDPSTATVSSVEGSGGERPRRRSATRAHHESLAKQVEDWVKVKPTEPRDPKSRKPKRIGPTAQGKFTRIDPQFPQISPKDGRLRPSPDAGAATGYRGGGRSRHSGFGTGRDVHALIDCGLLPDGTVKPPLLVAYSACPAGNDKGLAIRTAVDHAVHVKQPACRINADRGYSILSPDEIDIPLEQKGFQIVKDVHANQRKQKSPTHKALFLDGYFFSTGTPKDKVKLERLNPRDTRAVRASKRQKFDDRAAFAFQIHSETSTHIRFRGPSTFDAELDHNGNVIGYRKDRITARCPNNPLYPLMPTNLPTTTCPPGAKCYCSATFSVARKDLPSAFQRLIWGTTQWAATYFRRSLVETHNSQAQEKLHEGRRTYRIQAPKWDLFRMMFAIGLSLWNLHTWMCRLGVERHQTSDPAVTKAKIAPRLLPPESPPARRPRSVEPSSDPPQAGVLS